MEAALDRACVGRRCRSADPVPPSKEGIVALGYQAPSGIIGDADLAGVTVGGCRGHLTGHAGRATAMRRRGLSSTPCPGVRVAYDHVVALDDRQIWVNLVGRIEIAALHQVHSDVVRCIHSTLQMALPLCCVDRLQRRTFFSGLVRVPSGKYKFIAIRNWIFLRLIFSHFA